MPDEPPEPVVLAEPATAPDCSQPGAGACAGEEEVSEALPPPPAAFDFDDVREKARLLSEQDFVNPADLPRSAAELNYDQYRRIQNHPASALWATPDSAFRLLLDPRGYLFTHDVRLNVIEDGAIKAHPYSASEFDFQDLPLEDEVRESLGFAGFRVLTALNMAGKFDELVSFKGASFFRALGAGNIYGASARGLSLGTASPDGEEFPHFSEFWLARPADPTGGVTVYALMDGRSVTGAFEFTISGGPETRTDVTAAFFPRRTLTSVGVAPLTSMYQFSPHDLRKETEDFRPAVHDSEGLLVNLDSGEWAWRPLVNPRSLQISVLATKAPRGFGLIQRKRGLDAYADTEAEYHRRPNVWIQPVSEWGEGQLSLVEIPTANEYNDNIVVFWKPAEAWEPGQSYEVSYSMRWGLSPPAGMPVIPVSDTRSGRTPDKRRQLFVIDYPSADEGLIAGAQASLATSAGTIHNPVIKRHAETGKTRLSFELDAANEPVAELRALLTQGGAPITETWLYRWRAE